MPLVSDALRILRLCVLLLVIAAPAAAETRLALVIGNADYPTLGALRNPVNDATDIADALEALDFEVIRGFDLDRERMTELVTKFLQAARTSDVTLFYYAGHGFQIDDQNYLVPTDASFSSREDIGRETIKLADITEGLEGNGIHFVILDACRNNPLAALLGDDGGGLRDGLARVGDAAGFLFAFATQPNNVAYDGLGRNSYFTGAILSHIYTQGQDISSMMIDVRKDVLAATGGRQVPWENSSLTRQFYFRPGEPAASPETMLWQVAGKAQDPALMRIYLDRYPEGAHAADAERELEKITLAALSDNPNQAARDLPPAGDAVAVEDQIWDIARRTRARALVEVYLRQNPAGRHADEARRLLALLPGDDLSPGPLCERLATHPRDATANVAGVPLVRLAQNAEAAIEACRKATELQPEMPHYTALLARALSAAGRKEEAVALYRDAAARGDLRAMVSLGLITETGDGVPADLGRALALYARAAEAGSADGAINLAVALINGVGIGRDVPRAVTLLREASEAGSAIATYNLGVLAQDGVAGDPAEALAYFRRAAELGEPRAYLAAAVLLDEGRGVAADSSAAAEMLLNGAAADYGEALSELTENAENWSPATIKAVQSRLLDAGLYDGALDGLSGSRLEAALTRWRNGGFLDQMLGG